MLLNTVQFFGRNVAIQGSVQLVIKLYAELQNLFRDLIFICLENIVQIDLAAFGGIFQQKVRKVV